MAVRILFLVAMFVISVSRADAQAYREITVSAASSLTDAFREIGAGFEKETGIKAVFNFGASAALLKQVEAGAPVDVFASADEETMDDAERKGIVFKATRTDFAGNELVLAVPAGQARVAGLKDIAKAARIALANPDTAPAGRYAKQALTAMKLWEAVEPRCIYCPNVRQALDYVRRGEVDAGIVFMTDAASAGGAVKSVAILNGRVRYPAAVVSSSRNPEAARKFVQFLSGRKAQGILKKYGFKDAR